MNAATVELAGTRLSKTLNMVNTSMFVFKHPKYYKELRERNKSDQAISDEASTEATSVRPDPGHKPQAPSSKPQASSIKLSNQPEQATSRKLQAPSNKRQA